MNGWDDWDRVVIDGMAPLVDYHSLHIYTGSADHWTNVLQPHQAERAIRCARALIERATYVKMTPRPLRIAFDEWNVWYRTDDGTLEERYDFSDALAVGTYLNIFTRYCHWVGMANLAQMVNAIAPIVTTPGTAVTQPIYYPVLLHAQAALAVAADLYVDGPTVSLPADASTGRWLHRVADLGPFTLVDAAATVSTDRSRIALTLVNRHPDVPEPVRVTLRDMSFVGPAQLRTVTAGLHAGTAPGVQAVRIDEGSEPTKGPTLVLTLPPQSFTAVEAALASE